MATLRGQNFRILTLDENTNKYMVVGMATNCTINLTGNTESATTKDDTGMADKPTIVSKAWQVSVESLNVADAGAMMAALKSLKPFTLLWDEVGVADNQTIVSGSGIGKTGLAYLSDASFQFDNRTNSQKSLQFTGSGPLEDASSITQDIVPLGTYTKGQYVRLFLSDDNIATPSKVVLASQTLSIHFSVQLEETTTKDTTGDWQTQEPVGLSYDISTSALVRSGDTITSTVPAMTYADLQGIYLNSEPVKWEIANVNGDNNRTKRTVIVSGSAVMTALNTQSQNRSVVKYDMTLNGYGDYKVGA